MGVNTAYYQILAFVISAAYAGAAGALFAHLNTYISPDIFEFKSTLFVMTMTMVGGMGSLTGFHCWRVGVTNPAGIFAGHQELAVGRIWHCDYGRRAIHAGWRDRTYAPAEKISQDSPVLVNWDDLEDTTSWRMSQMFLEIEQLTMQFGGLVAVNDFSISVQKGEIHGLIGPNGSGKTTIFNVLSGYYKPTAGKIFFEGKENIRFTCPSDHSCRFCPHISKSEIVQKHDRA